MSPEQTRGEPLDAGTDIFSLGCVLYQAATGMMPFRGPSTLAIMDQIATFDPPPPSSLNLELPPQFDTFINRALAKHRTQRFTSMDEMAKTLAAMLTTAPMLTNNGFVGRQTEIAQLQHHLSSMLHSSGKTVLLIGEPGIGKTSLAEHFLRTVSPSDAFIARGRCVEHYGTGEAYLPFLDAIGTILHSALKDRATSVLRSHAPTWCIQFPTVFTSTAVLQSSQKEVSVASKPRMLRELSDALIELSVFRPFILFLEDLHWADPSTADLLRYLARRIRSQKILILATMREEDLEAGNSPMKACRLDLQENSLSEDIRLPLLSTSQVREFLDMFFSPNAFPKELSNWIFKKTEGQPLFVSSLFQFLINEKLAEKRNRVWSLTKTPSEMDLEIPENVLSLIRRKMESLPEKERRILQFASIEGVELNMDEIDLDEQLNKIEKTYRLIERTGAEEWPDGSIASLYHFSHSLYQNAFYRDLVPKRRVQLHKLAGESLFKHFQQKAPSIANQLGAHFRSGRDFEKAVYYLEIAGDYAKNVYANAEAELHYGEALCQLANLMQKAPEAWKPTAVVLHEKRGDSLSLLGHLSRAQQEYEAAVAHADSSSVLPRSRIYRKIAKVAETQGDFQYAFQFYKKAEDLLLPDRENQPIEMQREWLDIYLDRSWFYYSQNLQTELLRELSIIKPWIQNVGTATQKLRYYQNSINLALRRERYRISDEILSLAKLSENAAQETGIPSDAAFVNFYLGFIGVWGGDLKSAEKYLNLSLSQAVRLEDAVLQSRCLTYITWLFRKKHDVQRTEEFAERSLNLALAIHKDEYVAHAKAHQAWLRWVAGEPDEVKTLGMEAISIWQSLSVVTPFLELAVWPIIGVLNGSDRVSEACQYAELLLQPTQHKQHAEVEELLKVAIQADKEGNSAEARDKLILASNIVEAEGYL
jgi:eukaryotic-like serine/threonine-protein kinase